jgi:hypothetical protein
VKDASARVSVVAKHHHRTYQGEYLCRDEPGCEIMEELYINKMIENEYHEGIARLARVRNAEARPITT